MNNAASRPRTPLWIESIAQARHWANRMVKEFEAGAIGHKDRRNLTRRIAWLLRQNAFALSVPGSKAAARDLLDRAEQLYAKKLALRTPPQAMPMAVAA